MSISPQFAQDLYLRRTIGVAGGTLLLWDFLLTFGDEVEYIWSTRWSFAKCTFLANRYGNLICQGLINAQEVGVVSGSPTTFCFQFNYFISIFTLCSAESIHILVLVRAWAIWGCKKRMAAVLIAVYVAYFLLTLGITTFGTRKENNSGFFATDIIRTCVGELPSYIWLLWVASTLVDAMAFSLTMRCLRVYSRERVHLYPSPLLHLLYRDAIIFFIVSTLNNVLTIITWIIYSDNPKYFISVTFFLPILSISGQRLVLNLRRINMGDRRLDTDELGREVDRQLLGFHVGENGSHRGNGGALPEISKHSEKKQDEESHIGNDINNAIELAELNFQGQS